MLDIEQIRSETPGVAHVAHLNNAGSSLPPRVVLDAVIDYLSAEAIVGGYELAADRAADLADVYDAACALCGGEPQNWAFVESATRAWNAAFSALRFEPGDRILTTTAEYPSNMGGILRAREREGATVEIVPDDADGQVDLAVLESMLDSSVKLVSLTHVPTQGGLINPAIDVGAMLRDTDILYQLDACQSVGQIPINVDEIGCDILSFTGRKFVRGPRGTGMVWANDAALERMGLPAGVDMHGATWDAPMSIAPLPSARRFEPYEVFFAGKVGLAVALRYASDIGIAAIEARNRELAGRLRSGLDAIAGARVADKGVDRSALVTFAVAGVEPQAIKAELRTQGINVSTSGVNSARLDFPERGITELVRASVHYYNTPDEVDRLLAVVERLAAGSETL